MEKRILVIDDEEAIRDSFVDALEETSYQVETACSGEEGLNKFERIHPHLVFLDLKMPGMNGVETLKDIRERDKKVVVYIQTAFAKEYMDLLEAASQRGDEFELVYKPLDSDQILSITKGLFNKDGQSEG